MVTEVGAAGPAWEEGRLSSPAGMARTWWESLTRPTAFFERVDFAGSLARPVLYFLVVSIAASLLAVLAALGGMDRAALDFFTEQYGVDARGVLVLGFFLSPFYALIGLGLASVVLHSFATLLAPDHGGLKATTRVVCYGAAPGVFAWVPYVGGVVALAWWAFLLAKGFRRAHSATPGRAAAIVLVPGILALLAVVLLVIVLTMLAGAVPGVLRP